MQKVKKIDFLYIFIFHVFGVFFFTKVCFWQKHVPTTSKLEIFSYKIQTINPFYKMQTINVILNITKYPFNLKYNKIYLKI